MAFEDDLDADLDAQLATEPDFSTVTVLLNGKPRNLRFTQMEGLAWGDLCDRNPPRFIEGPGQVPKVLPVDNVYGYNVLGASVLAAEVSGKMQSGDEWLSLTPERWKKLIRSLPGAQLRALADAIWNLNQWAPAQAVVDAKKASEVASAMNSFSPALSESPDPD